MVIYREFKGLKSLAAPVHWAMGMFDGVHLGHVGVIAAAVKGAALDGGIPAVLTFRTHPLARVRPESVPPAIMGEDAEKFALMKELGVKAVLSLEFSSRLASMSPEEFIGELCSSCLVAQIAVGEDWHFGRGRAGNVETLRLLSCRYGFRVTAVPSILQDGERISSTRIREAVRAADFLQAAGMLGRPYRWKGPVIHGRQLGRLLDYPTANMRPGCGLQPPHGVYAVRARVAGKKYGGVANLGVRPTVEGETGELLLETHLFGHPGDIYGREMEVEPVRFLRPEIKFPSLEELKSQLARDAAHAAEALDFFDEITLFTEHDLSAEFTSRMGRYLTPSCRGFGYWSWKPWSIHHVLQEMEEGDRLLYLDAGCHINANGTDRFREYVNMLDRDSRGMLVFTNGQPEYKWTKGDIFRHFGVSQEDGHITHTQQIAGGHVFLKKNPLTESLIRDWLHVFYDHLHLADNTPSASPNLPGFVENRYDQSIFSILCKLRGITTLDGSETYAENWEQLSLFPFQDRRDMGIPRAGKKGWLEKCRQLLLSSKRNGFGIR